MSGGAGERERAEELLLARISATAGRARLGRRHATHRALPIVPGGRWTATADVRRLLGAGGAPVTRAAARLDLYEHGVTLAVGRQIHVIRFDTTVVRRRKVLSARGITRALVLVDVDGERVVLRCGDFGWWQEWWPAIRRAVVAAQTPRALAALHQGARLAFGPVWLTAAEVGCGTTVLGWSRVRRIEILNGFVAVRADGRWQVWATAASGIPNLCVFQALAEHLVRAARDDG